MQLWTGQASPLPLSHILLSVLHPGISDSDSPRYSHPDDKVSSFFLCHCRASDTVSPNRNCYTFLGLQWHWSASGCRNQPEAIDSGHCLMETIPQHLQWAETKGKWMFKIELLQLKLDYSTYLNWPFQSVLYFTDVLWSVLYWCHWDFN